MMWYLFYSILCDSGEVSLNTITTNPKIHTCLQTNNFGLETQIILTPFAPTKQYTGDTALVQLPILKPSPKASM